VEWAPFHSTNVTNTSFTCQLLVAQNDLVTFRGGTGATSVVNNNIQHIRQQLAQLGSLQLVLWKMGPFQSREVTHILIHDMGLLHNSEVELGPFHSTYGSHNLVYYSRLSDLSNQEISEIHVEKWNILEHFKRFSIFYFQKKKSFEKRFNIFFQQVLQNYVNILSHD
jgi:hypothetical protein